MEEAELRDEITIMIALARQEGKTAGELADSLLDLYRENERVARIDGKKIEDVLKDFYYHDDDSGELGEDAFRPIRVDQIAEVTSYINGVVAKKTKDLKRKNFILSGHLAHMAGEFEGYFGHKNGYLLKNWKEYGELSNTHKTGEV